MQAVRGKRQVANGAIGLARLSIIPDAAIHHAIEIGIFVDTVNKAEVGVIGADGCQPLLELRNSGSRLGRPPIRSAFVQRSDMHLDVHPVAMTAENAPHHRERGGLARDEIEMVDTGVNRRVDGALNLSRARVMQPSRSKSGHADLVAAMRQSAILHVLLRCCTCRCRRLWLQVPVVAGTPYGQPHATIVHLGVHSKASNRRSNSLWPPSAFMPRRYPCRRTRSRVQRVCRLRAGQKSHRSWR